MKQSQVFLFVGWSSSLRFRPVGDLPLVVVEICQVWIVSDFFFSVFNPHDVLRVLAAWLSGVGP